MIEELNNTFFTQYGKFIAYQHKKHLALPFKDHPQFSILLDTLSRKDHHHALIQTDFSTKMLIAFLETLLLHLCQDNMPNHLRYAECIYFNYENCFLTKEKYAAIENDFQKLLTWLDVQDKYLLVILPSTDFLSYDQPHPDHRFLCGQLNLLLSHPKCRFLVFVDNNNPHLGKLNDDFSLLSLKTSMESDIIPLLKRERTELENFHHVLMFID